MIYLASPYSHEDPFIRETRYLNVAKVLWERYLTQGVWAYSPIVHCHEIAKMYSGNKGFDFWEPYDLHILRRCDALHVLRIDGWEGSRGVTCERKEAERVGIPVVYI